MNSEVAIENLAVPATLEAALDPAWLTLALARVLEGRRVVGVETVEVLRTVATKVRFKVSLEGQDHDRDQDRAFCIKGLLDVDEMTSRGGPTMVREADFYTKVGPSVAVRTPTCVAAITDRERQQGIVVMRDLIADGARFCSALEPFTAEEAAASLDQIAALHAGSGLLAEMGWITPRIAQLATMPHMTPAALQELLDGPRGTGLSAATKDAARLAAAMGALAERDAARPQFLVHGDVHAGNIFRDAQGRTGLIDWQILQRGGWALDLAYHICAVLPVELAEREERTLLDHYLGTVRGLGCEVPGREEAWRQYREAAVYGFYLWSITRRVDPPIIDLFVNRLGRAVERHESHALLGVA